jgi:hypothetical protein
MSPAAATGCGPLGNITAPSGTLVTSWGKRSFIENGATYGWTFESGTASQTTPTVVAEIRASDGSARFSGGVSGASLTVNTTYAATLGSISSSWGGSTGYPTLYGHTADRWVMHINPHISYTENGVNGYTGTTNGSLIRFAGQPAASTYWDVGVGNSGVGTEVFSIGRMGTSFLKIDSSANLRFNSGYGSAATAYGCRAWVNFNGQGTVAIRASGNVSSITDNGTGRYTVNFTNAMPDTNYNCVGCCSAISGRGQAALMPNEISGYLINPTTTAQAVFTCHDAGGVLDPQWAMVSIFR